MNSDALLKLENAKPVPWEHVPVLDYSKFQVLVIEGVRDEGKRLVALVAIPTIPKDISSQNLRLVAVLADDEKKELSVLSTHINGKFQSITSLCSSAHMFEREIAEIYGVTPQRHPWLKPVRFIKASLADGEGVKTGKKVPNLPAVTNFFRVEGAEVHEVAVGPVHAGIIEPGHFRFQCHGENVMHLEIALGYQFRGIESRLKGGPNTRTLHYMETLAGDTTIGHSLTYARIIEGLLGLDVSPDEQALRGIALELERLANHTGDLGALANDVGYLPTASYCGRIRGDFLNLSALFCGNRFGRGLIIPGGVRFGADEERIVEFKKRLTLAKKDVTNAVNLLWKTSSVVGRFLETGIVSQNDARGAGLVGVAARASGVNIDVRSDFPFGIFKTESIKKATQTTGDVYARGRIRWLEIKESIDFIERICGSFSKISVDKKNGFAPLPSNQFSVSLTEGWRGEICHISLTGQDGTFTFYKVVDPSFHNWFGLALALREQQISDFPLCNKSFNLSYCGHDL